MKLELLLICFEMWGVVDGSDATPATSDVASLIAWKVETT